MKLEFKDANAYKKHSEFIEKEGIEFLESTDKLWLSLDLMHEISEMITEWDVLPEHDLDFAIRYKDTAYDLLKKIRENAQ
jgi:hypothetical protein